MADCADPYYHDARDWEGAGFRTDQHAQLFAQTVLPGRHRPNANAPASSRRGRHRGYGLDPIG
ncbi:hypothetical protein D3C77_613640 [compost metagenome]